MRAIKGEYAPDLITQAELLNAAELQATVWMAEKNARECVQGIERRIEQGARIEPGNMIFDRELQMARSKKRKDGSA